MATKGNNKKNREKTCLMILTYCLVFTGVWVVLVSPQAALAKKPSGQGGGGDTGHGTESVCVYFLSGDGISADDSDGVPDEYCHNKKDKIEAVIDSGGFVRLTPNTVSHKDPDGGRKLFVDLGRPLFLSGPEIDFQGTRQDVLDQYDPGMIVSHNEQLLFRLNDGTDLRDMPIGEPQYDNANMRIIINLEYSTGATGNLVINIDPSYDRNGCTGAGSTDTVDVARLDDVTWEVVVDGINDKAALLETYRSTGSPGAEAVFFCHTDLAPPYGEEPFILPAFTFQVVLAQ